MAEKAKVCPQMAKIESLVLNARPDGLKEPFGHAQGCLACKAELLRLGAWPLGCVDPFDGYLVRCELEEEGPEVEAHYVAHRDRCVPCALIFKKAAKLRPPKRKKRK